MGEYARRKSDGQQVKIGTCESMYYCRHDQLKDIDYPYPIDNCFWRIPTPDEDGMNVGDYEYGALLQSASWDASEKIIPLMLRINSSKFRKDDCENMQKSGTMQLVNREMGLLVNVHCPHGLPLNGEDSKSLTVHENGKFLISYGYNGHRGTLHLAFLKNTEKELRVGIKCCCCGAMFSFSFSAIEPMIESLWMRLRLLHQCADYWYQQNEEPFNDDVTALSQNHKRLTIMALSYNNWYVEEDGEVVVIGDWETCRNAFIRLLPTCSEVSALNERSADYEDMSWAAYWGDLMRERYIKI